MVSSLCQEIYIVYDNDATQINITQYNNNLYIVVYPPLVHM